MSTTLLVIIGVIGVIDLIVLLALLRVAKSSDRRLENQGVLHSEEQAASDAKQADTPAYRSRGSTIR